MEHAVRALLVMLLMVSSAGVYADHGASEPSDGTVNSFITVDPPRPVEPVALVRNRTESMDLAAFKGKVVLLNLWATWCPPCLRELPALDRLQERHGDDDFEVVAVALDRAGYEAFKAYYEELDIKNLALYHSSTEEFGRAFPVDVFPASFFIDRDGRVLSFLRSYADWDAPEADALVRKLKEN